MTATNVLPPKPAARLFGVLTVLLAVGCGHLPFESTTRQPQLMAPPELRPAFGSWGFTTEILEELSSDQFTVYRFSFETYCDVLGRTETVSGELYRPTTEGPHPLIAVAPILGGAVGNYIECRAFGEYSAEQDYASYYLYQDVKLLKAYEEASSLERRLRQWVRSMIKALDTISDHYPIDEQRLGTFGISLGGIRTVVLAAAEPRFKAHVVCMAGGGIPRIVDTSQEGMVLRYMRRRTEVQRVSRERIVQDFHMNLLTDPASVASAIDPSTVLMFIAEFDNKVPVETCWLLHEALGRPECRTSPTGHYTSIVVLPWAISHSYEFFARKFTADAVGSEGR